MLRRDNLDAFLRDSFLPFAARSCASPGDPMAFGLAFGALILQCQGRANLHSGLRFCAFDSFNCSIGTRLGSNALRTASWPSAPRQFEFSKVHQALETFVLMAQCAAKSRPAS